MSEQTLDLDRAPLSEAALAAVQARLTDVQVLLDEIRCLCQTQRIVYRVEQHGIPLGTYATREAARAAGEAAAEIDEPFAQQSSWHTDDDSANDELSAETLFLVVAGEEVDTCCVVTPLLVEPHFDPEAES